ncbi:hypothetical protein TNCV_4924131 [Trichonephila clavipes]|nr:hypothetical protein TNCV_4924131 [Trichonephila clavipes]
MYCCNICHLTDSNISSRPTEFFVGGGWIFTPVVSRSIEHYAGVSTILLCSTPILRQKTLVEVRDLSPPSTNLPSGLAARKLFRVPYAAKEIMYLHASMLSLGFKPRLYGTEFSVTNHYIGRTA